MKVTRWAMVKAAWDTPWYWREMCELARCAGWTYKQVMRVLIFAGPLAALVYFMLGVALIAVISVRY